MDNMLSDITRKIGYIGEQISSACPALYSKMYDYCLRTANELNRDDLKMLLATGHPVACLGAVTFYRLKDLKNKIVCKREKRLEDKI